MPKRRVDFHPGTTPNKMNVGNCSGRLSMSVKDRKGMTADGRHNTEAACGAVLLRTEC